MAIAGKRSLIKMSSDAVAFSSEAAESADDISYVVASTSIKDIPWAPAVAITVTDTGGSTQTGYTVNRLNGSITFSSSDSRTLNISGSYLPLVTRADAFAFSLNLIGNNADVTDFSTDRQFIDRDQQLKDVTGTLSEWYTTTGSTQWIQLMASTADMPVVIEFFSEHSTAFDARMWALIAEESVDAAVADAIDDTIPFEGRWDAENRVITFSTRGLN